MTSITNFAGGGGGYKTLILALLALAALLATFALTLTPTQAHPCVTPTEDFGTLQGRVVRSDVVHGGSCTTVVNGNGRWMNTYDFTLVERTVVQIDLENISDLDPYLRLLDASGSVVASNDDGGNGLNARIRQTLDRGSYRIQATKYNVEAGHYRLTVVVEGGTSSDPPTAGGDVSGDSATVRSLDAGAHYTCVVTGAGDIRCWGKNDDGQTDAPPGQFTQVSAGLSHVCAIAERGNLRCWGQTVLGDPTAQGGEFTHVNAAAHTCAITVTGDTRCWGWNHRGQTNVPTGRFTQVSGGGWHTCGLRSDGVVQCWGGNESGQASAPAGRFTQVSSGAWFTCGVTTGGAVRCWGGNESGQTDVPSGRFAQVAAGSSHACALTPDGEVRCWGWNVSGQATPPSGRFSRITAGTYHSCGLRETGAIECWGLNDDGQTDVPEDLATPAEPAAAGCPEPAQLFRVTATTSTTPVTLTRPARLDTTCQVDGFQGGLVRPADRYEFTLDKPARMWVELSSSAFEPRIVLTDAAGEYSYMTSTDEGTWLSLVGSRAADGDGDAIIRRADAGGVSPLSTPASLDRIRLEPGTYWLFAASKSGSRTGDYRLEVEYERIADSESLDQRIAERFAPVILFEQDEDYFPVPVELMIRLSTLHYTQNGQPRTKAPGTYRLSDLSSHNGRESYLDLPDAENVRRYTTGERVVYARVAETYGANAGVLVQYWFFYLYNATGVGAFNHEGDWEGVQLWFAGLSPADLLTANVPTQIGWAAHESGWALTPDAESCAEINAPTVPNVYVARNRHASYPKPGSAGEFDKSFPGWARDQFQGNGAAWALQGVAVPDVEGELGYELRMLPTDPNQSWLAWNGRWGDPESGSGGPRGPAFKSHFWLPPVRNGWSLTEFDCWSR